MKAKQEILVLDDEEVVCEKLKDHLVRQGYTVEVFTDSQEALKRLGEKVFDVVITDLKMAGADGIDVLVNIKDQNVHTQVIIITGYPDIESRLAAKYKDAFEYLVKPFTFKEIDKLTEKAMKKALKLKAKEGS